MFHATPFIPTSLLLLIITFTARGASDTLSPAQQLTPDRTLVSPGGVFELGFFSPSPSSAKRYLGIWYKSIPDKKVVWVANRDSPVTSAIASLLITQTGNLAIFQDSRKLVWLSNQTSIANATNLVAQLLDTGNFVLRYASNDGDIVWQSFDHPTDTLLPGMKLGWDFKTNSDRFIRAWKSPEDPSSGDFAFILNPAGFPEIFLWKDKIITYRSGPWNGLRFSGVPEMKQSEILDFIFETSSADVYYYFELKNKSVLSRLVVNSTGMLQRFTWVESSHEWNPYWYAPKDQCDHYKECGGYGVCDTNASPVCKCLTGFEPRNPEAWFLRDGSDGCARRTELDCRTDGFAQLQNVKLPQSSGAYVDKKMTIEDCGDACARNCSCTAYAHRDITGKGSGCVMWSGELEDLRVFADAGQTLYVKLAASDLGHVNGINSKTHAGKAKGVIKIVGIVAGVGILSCCLAAIILRKRKALQRKLNLKTARKGPSERSQDLLLNEVVITSKRDYTDESNPDELELPLYDFSAMQLATDKFSEENKLGQGGFGSVYKGTLSDGQLVAVKRLAKTSGQGMEEFKNELRLIARLQHRNLVRLLGCCVQMDEKMLIYEYLEHRSLDSTLFNPERSSMLNWEKRYNIICGIARGLLYLHQDSRFRIIHRDLKASNVLLDGELNPKISDFGMARIFSQDQTEANTKRVVGTYGYMSPEYAMDGLFSVKSDVFSFGVLVLEIISGKKNRGFYYTDHELNLLGHAWNLWREHRALELMDPEAGDSYPASEVLRCIQVGLLCVQEHAEDRPVMSTVVVMLSSDTASLPQPKTPGFCLRRNNETDSSSSKHENHSCTVNEVTVTMLHGR
uniref:Receptor-like serine/threonine-protein kinase n=1 Tax=Kalanchoe fedtschenkoi TaxID=63787 RepID=A0A7N1A823_KALFE